jgi:hypothetical protein
MSSTQAAESSGNDPEDLARAYLVALRAKDKNAILSIVTDDFELEVPCSVSGTNDLSDSWRGIEAASAGWDDAFERSRCCSIPISSSPVLKAAPSPSLRVEAL